MIGRRLPGRKNGRRAANNEWNCRAALRGEVKTDLELAAIRPRIKGFADASSVMF
jgi:hypothetical protein